MRAMLVTSERSTYWWVPRSHSDVFGALSHDGSASNDKGKGRKAGKGKGRKGGSWEELKNETGNRVHDVRLRKTSIHVTLVRDRTRVNVRAVPCKKNKIHDYGQEVTVSGRAVGVFMWGCFAFINT